MVMNLARSALGAIPLISFVLPAQAEDLGSMWGTAEKEAEYYRIVDIPIPAEVPMHPGSFEVLPDGRLVLALRRLHALQRRVDTAVVAVEGVAQAPETTRDRRLGGRALRQCGGIVHLPLLEGLLRSPIVHVSAVVVWRRGPSLQEPATHR